MIKKSLKRIIPPFLFKLLATLYTVFCSITFYFYRKVARHSYAKIPLFIYIYNQISHDWYDRDFYRGEIDFLQKFRLKTNSRVFNIGSHHGVIALIMSKIVGPTGEVIAVEMNKEHVNTSLINKRLNRANNLHIIHSAVSNHNSNIRFNFNHILYNDNEDGLEVRTITIDELSSKFGIPTLLYIDVEGYEAKVLEGAINTFRSLPDCCVEIHVGEGLEKYNNSVDDIISLFPTHKYKLYIAPCSDETNFIPYNKRSKIIKKRFYLAAIKI